MHAWLFILEHIVNSVRNICKRATQVRQLSNFRYRLVYKCSNTLYMYTKTLEPMKIHFTRVMVTTL